MALQRWDPFAEVRRFHSYFDRNHFEGRRPGYFATGHQATKNSWYIPLDAVEEGDDLLVRASVPGVKPEDIEVTIEDGILSIKGETKSEHEVKEAEYLMREHRSGSFHRSVRLPDTVDADKAETGYENGVLTIKLPKVEAKKAKRLEISVGKELKTSSK
ncbi:MAG: hypothetical protein BZY80_00270 [SAR202 cluster bacterium Io17-Chloro-G2]|nr:MAG: hypothetical protein BZY80_00270 [SAR202 cluster bacterium Io17-Chloro-G2]